MKLFPTRESLQAYMHNQIADCESEGVQRLLTQNKVGAPMATSKYPTCGQVKIPHLGRQLEITY